MQIIYNVNGNIVYKYLPIVDGGTIYVNKGSKLTEADAQRGMVDNDKYNDLKHADSYTWDTSKEDYQVDTNKAGQYDGMVDVGFKIGDTPTKISVGVKVIVVDLQGKEITTHIGADIPAADTGVDGQPSGATATWTDKPSTDKAGDSKGIVEVTYPDGTKGTANVILHVIAPVPEQSITVWQGDPVPSAESGITNSSDINSKFPGTTYTWETTPSTANPGSFPATVITHWTDSKTTSSQTTIIVKATSSKTETRNVVRTIIENLPNEAPKTIEQTVTFTRTNVVDSADENNVIHYGEWTTNDPLHVWPLFTPDQVEGYTADPAQLPAMYVTANTPDARVYINYKANNPGNPSTPVDPGDNPIPVTPPVNPTPGDNPTNPTPNTNNDTPAPTPHATNKPTKDKGSKKSNGKNSRTGKKNRTKNFGLGQGEKVNNGRRGAATVRPLANAKPNSPAVKKVTNVDNNQKSTLPQTGDKDNIALAAVGAAIAAAGSLLGLAGNKKRKS